MKLYLSIHADRLGYLEHGAFCRELHFRGTIDDVGLEIQGDQGLG